MNPIPLCSMLPKTSRKRVINSPTSDHDPEVHLRDLVRRARRAT